MKKPVNKKSDSSGGKKEVKKQPEKSLPAGRTPHQVMSRHIRDKDDVISEEDFKNLVIGAEVTDTAEKPLELTADTKRPKDEDKDPGIIIPWDLVK